jgi:hypothetical protein
MKMPGLTLSILRVIFFNKMKIFFNKYFDEAKGTFALSRFSSKLVSYSYGDTSKSYAVLSLRIYAIRLRVLAIGENCRPLK